MAAPSREDAEGLDQEDPLAEFVERFVVHDPELIYFDGNSLGRLPIATRDRLAAVVDEEWGGELVRGWDHWIDLPRQVGDRLGALLGAQPGEVLVCDSTTINLYKLASAVLELVPERRKIVVSPLEFPTDRYVLEGLAASTSRKVATQMDSDTALVVASMVDFRTAERADVDGVMRVAAEVGARVIWDLCHAVGAVDVDLGASGVEFAVGCTYKYLSAGPGAPAFLYVRSDLQEQLRQPIWGWFGQRDQFAMGPAYEPLRGIERFLTGTPSVLGLSAVDEGVALIAEAGIERVEAKGRALTDLMVALADEWLSPHAFEVVSPREPAKRGAHVAVRHPDAAAFGESLIAQANVVVDWRPPDLLRLCPSPLSSRFVDAWDGMARIRGVVS